MCYSEIMLLRYSIDFGVYRSDSSAEIKGDQAYPDEELNSVLGKGKSNWHRPGEEKIRTLSLFSMPQSQNIRDHVVRNRTGEVSRD